jgi:hypothetical protein
MPIVALVIEFGKLLGRISLPTTFPHIGRIAGASSLIVSPALTGILWQALLGRP